MKLSIRLFVFFTWQWLFVFTPISYAYVPSLCLNSTSDNLKQLRDYQPIVCNAIFGQEYSHTVNNSVEHIYVFHKNVEEELSSPPRITVQSNDAEKEQPLLVVVTQLKSILSWQIPLETPNTLITYNKVARTLCPDPDSGAIVVTISTRGENSINFTLVVDTVTSFNLKISHLYINLTVSPAEPQYFRFVFDNDTSSALLHVESEDSPCMSLSIQNNSCPVYDLEKTVQYRGLWQTVLTKGGIFLRKEEFPVGLFIVFVVHSTNEACTGIASSNEIMTKRVAFQLERSIGFWDYMIAVGALLGGFLLIYISAAGLILCQRKKREDCGGSIKDPEYAVFPHHDYSTITSCVTTPTTPIFPAGNSDYDSDVSETDVDLLHDIDTSRSIMRTKPILFLSDLAQKDPRVLSVKSKLYLWNMGTVAVFYALPVVQLVFTYQQVLIQSGNQDLCYYNFLCSHRLWFITDFNHVFSNAGYFLFGFLFLLLTYRRQKLCHSVGSHLGIPYHYGMFYALGVALCMEGVLSACYHLCPNHSNFQFDTSFMYVLSILSMMKIYQTRHPDITAGAHTLFGIMALVIFLGMFGVLNGSSWFYVLFTIAHLLTCLVITAQIYHVGTWKFDLGMFTRFASSCKNDYRAGGLRHCLRPTYPARMLLLFLANIGNWGLVAIGYYLHLRDFATYMLSIFLANLMMYFIFYIVMKKVSKETILYTPFIYILLSFAFWTAGLYFFYHKSISWKLTPAESRAYNQPCEILNFYDKHDIWHILSAGALFFSFMVLLTLDDDIAEKDRRVIPVF